VRIYIYVLFLFVTIVVDLDHAREIEVGESAKSWTGFIPFRAPEMHVTHLYTNKVDIWALALLLTRGYINFISHPPVHKVMSHSHLLIIY
jgi:hypothetical protein